MALVRNAYEELESIVGPENISEEPAVLDSYAKEHRAKHYIGGPYMKRFEAIVMPARTEEVQAIVKTCNKYGIKFKARSSGFFFFNSPLKGGCINIDLWRMNKILEINEQNMYAVVEPGVNSVSFQAELMKRGLRANIIGAGASTTALPIPAASGLGHTGLTTSNHDRNLLAVEWVTPSGEIVRFGSLGSANEYFCGDGPGPSLRGVIRGVNTPLGGLGVFTKAATKVYHWPGPPVPRVEGVSPYYQPLLPEFFKAYYLCWPSWDKLIDAVYEIGESEIASALDRMSAFMVTFGMTPTNEEGAALFSKFREAGADGPNMVAHIYAETKKELNYKEKVLQHIMEKSGAKSLPMVEEPSFSHHLIWNMLRGIDPIRCSIRPAQGGHASNLGALGTLPPQIQLMLRSHEIKEEYLKKQKAVDDGIWCWIAIIENGHYSHAENILQVDSSPEGRKGLAEYGETAFKGLEELHIGSTSFGLMGDAAHNRIGPQAGNYHLWLRKIKAAFDPNLSSESLLYVTPSGGEEAFDLMKGVKSKE